MGRFTGRDWIGYAGGRNLYGYVGGRPTRYVDPLGLVEAEPVPPDDFPGTPPIAGGGLHDSIQDAKDHCMKYCAPLEGRLIPKGQGARQMLFGPVEEDLWDYKQESKPSLPGFLPGIGSSKVILTVYRYDVYELYLVKFKKYNCDCEASSWTFCNTMTDWFGWLRFEVVTSKQYVGKVRVWKEAYTQVIDSEVEFDIEEIINELPRPKMKRL